MLCDYLVEGQQLPFLPCMIRSSKKNKLIFSCFPLLFTYLCLSLFLLLFVSHFSFVFCLICLPSANAFHPRVCGLQPLQPSGLQQPPTGRELRRLQQGNELMEGLKQNIKTKQNKSSVLELIIRGIVFMLRTQISEMKRGVYNCGVTMVRAIYFFYLCLLNGRHPITWCGMA